MNFRPLLKTFSQGDGSLDEAVLMLAFGTVGYVVIFGVAILHFKYQMSGTDFGGGLAAIWAGTGALMRIRGPGAQLPPDATPRS